MKHVAGFRHFLAQHRPAFHPGRPTVACWAKAWFAVALGLALVLGIAGLSTGALAQSESAVAPLREPPAGYASERDGNVRWTYPLSAADEVSELRVHQRTAWRQVLSELGTQVSGELDIRVALNPEQMQALAPPHSALPGYADGIAFPKLGLILLTLTAPETFIRPDMNRVLTHELSHIALDRAVRGQPLPRWFSEGVAVHQAGESSLTRIQTLWNGTLRGKLLSLDELSHSFPNNHNQVDLAYAQSADFLGFLLAGRDEQHRFHTLLRDVAAGKTLEHAVQANYQVPLAYLEREWRATLQRRFGRWPALFMGLTFVWVLGAGLLVAAYVRSRMKHRATLQRWAIEEAPILNAPVPVAVQPTGASQSSVDDFFDNRRGQNDAGVPTVIHDGQQHTLH